MYSFIMDANLLPFKDLRSIISWLSQCATSFGWWRVAALVMLAVLFYMDHPLRHLVLANRTPLLTYFFYNLKYVGKFLVGFGLAAVLLMIGKYADKPRLLRSGKIMFFGLLLGGTVVLVGKPLLAIHPRPMFVAQPAEQKSKIRWGRFPSGDSVVAFAIAAALVAEFPILAVPGVIIGLLVGVELVYFNQHFFSDVFAGAWVSIEIVRLLKRKFPSPSPAEF